MDVPSRAGPTLREEALIADLVGDLTPQPRLYPPLTRAALWLGAVAVFVVGVALYADLPAFARRTFAAPDLALAYFGSIATLVLSAVAAFHLALPDRRDAWALLPLPGLALWLGAAGLGCFRDWIAPEMHIAPLAETRECFTFIVGFSAPLSALILHMLARAHPLRPGLVTAMGGLAAAAAANVLLAFVHPFDAAITDLATHAVAVLCVVALNMRFGGRYFARGETTPDFARA
jgi:hypothetical protein